MKAVPFALSLFALIISIAPSSAAVDAECTRTSHMQIYSVVSNDRETGDLDGYELAIEQHADSTVDAWLYIYEGAPNEDAIHISGTISGKKLALRGTWAEHTIEYPSKKDIVEIHRVEVSGTLDPNSFLGTLKIEDLYTPDHVELKRAHTLWSCKR